MKKFIAQFTEEARALNKLNNEVEENNRLHAERVRQEANTRAAMERRMRSEATMMNQAVQQFHKAQQEKIKAANEAAETQERNSRKNINNINREIEKLREQARAMREGSGRETGNVIFRLTQAGASPQQIAEAQRLRKEIEELGRAARQSENKFWGLQGVLRGLFPIFGALSGSALIATGGRKFVEVADAVELLSNRIRILSNETVDFEPAFARLKIIADTARAPIMELGTLYARLLPVMQSVGQTAEYAEDVTKAFA